MRYRLLGSAGLRVSEFALGTMTFGERRSWGIDERAARLIMDKFAEAGRLVDDDRRTRHRRSTSL